MKKDYDLMPKPIAFRVTMSQFDRLKELCSEQLCSKGTIIRQALKYYFDRIDTIKKQ